MTFTPRRTAIMTSLAVIAMTGASGAWAAAQQSTTEPVVVQSVRVAPKVEIEPMLRMAQELQDEMRLRPMLRMPAVFGPRSGGVAGRVLSNAEELELTDAQEQSIRDAQRAFRRDEIRRNADIEIAELELDEMMENDNADLVAIETHMRQIANLQVDARIANLRLDRDVRAVLTAEQVDKLKDLSPAGFVFETLQRQRQRNR